jgi:hypothetical protein
MNLRGRDWQRDRVDPYPEELMNSLEMPGTICGVLREMYQRSEDPEVKILARIGVSMAKKISKKLNYYHNESKLPDSDTRKV